MDYLFIAYLLDTQKVIYYLIGHVGELRQFYRLTPIAVIGGSFLPGLTGHNFSEAAAAGCAVLTGKFMSWNLNLFYFLF